MRDNAAAAVEIYRRTLELSAVSSGETVAVLAPEGAMHERAEGFAHAARSLGANSYTIVVPRGTGGPGTTGRSPLSDRNVLELLKKADMVIDLVKLLFSEEQLELQAAGCRVLLAVEPLPILERLAPTVELRKTVEAAAARLERVSELRITSRWGTDVTYELGNYPIMTEYGYTDEPGRWDHWPSGFVLTHGGDTGVNGKIVLKAGDQLFFPITHYVRDQIDVTIEAGYITRIDGDNLDAMLLRDFYAPAGDDREAYGMSHVGWGLNPDAKWSPNDTIGAMYMEARSFAGNVMISTGPNREVGGTRDTPFHLDIPMRDCSLELDSVKIIDEGQLL